MQRYLVILTILFFLFYPPFFALNEHIGHEHSSEEAHALHENSDQPTVKMSIFQIDDKGDKKLIKIKLSHIKDGSPLTESDLKVVHTEKIHLLLIDWGLEDYHHIHPKIDTVPGVYTFEWSPKKKANYKMWADLHPSSTDVQEYVSVDLITGQKSSSPDKTVSKNITVDNYNFMLSLEDKELKAGKATLGKIYISDEKGKPIQDLEPIMGAFAHIVGFGDDLNYIVHVHPMGDEPSSPADRGGPELQFHLQPEKPGFIKLFAQIKIHGKELYVPFVIKVEENN